MSNPLFSIVIPTRDRPGTLIDAVRTCLNQNFDDYEVVVSDNGSQSSAEETLRNLARPHLRVVKTPSSLAMTASWEFALSQAHGQYIIFIGDDDGLLAGALEKLAPVVSNRSLDAVTWEVAYYNWPDSVQKWRRNVVQYPVGGFDVEIPSQSLIAEVANFRRYPSFLPCIYHSAISKRLIDRMKTNHTSFFSDSIAPDIFSGFVIAHKMKSILRLARPITIQGTSGSSNGAAQATRGKGSRVAEVFDQMNQAQGMKIHGDLPQFSRSLPTIIASEYLRSLDYLGLKDSQLNGYAYYQNELILENHPQDWEQKRAALLKSRIGSELDVSSLASNEGFYHCRAHFSWPAPIQNISFSSFSSLDGREFNLKNVMDVSLFYGEFENRFLSGRALTRERPTCAKGALSYYGLALMRRLRRAYWVFKNNFHSPV